MIIVNLKLLRTRLWQYKNLGNLHVKLNGDKKDSNKKCENIMYVKLLLRYAICCRGEEMKGLTTRINWYRRIHYLYAIMCNGTVMGSTMESWYSEINTRHLSETRISSLLIRCQSDSQYFLLRTERTLNTKYVPRFLYTLHYSTMLSFK